MPTFDSENEAIVDLYCRTISAALDALSIAELKHLVGEIEQADQPGSASAALPMGEDSELDGVHAIVNK
jgi:hypothetical protein